MIRASTSLRGMETGVDGTLGFGAVAGVYCKAAKSRENVGGACGRRGSQLGSAWAGLAWSGVECGLNFSSEQGSPGRLWRVRLARFFLGRVNVENKTNRML